MDGQGYGNDTGLRITVSLLRHSHYLFKATSEVNRDGDVWWTSKTNEHN